MRRTTIHKITSLSRLIGIHTQRNSRGTCDLFAAHQPRVSHPRKHSRVCDTFRDLVTIMASSSYFYLVPAFTHTVTNQIVNGWIALSNSASNTIHVGAHVVFSNGSRPQPMSHYPQMISDEGMTYFVQSVSLSGDRFRIASSYGAKTHIYSCQFGETFPAGTTATIAVHSLTSECQLPQKNDFVDSIQRFEFSLRGSLNLQSSHQTFLQWFQDQQCAKKQCWRAMAKVSSKSASFDFSAGWKN